MHASVALVTLLALVLFVWMIFRVGSARAKFGVAAPAVSGHPEFERLFRIQANTLESLIVFLPSLWIFAIYSKCDYLAAGLGLVWIIGRIIYAVGYAKAAEKRGPGFGIQGLALLALLLGSIGLVIWHVVQAKGF